MLKSSQPGFRHPASSRSHNYQRGHLEAKSGNILQWLFSNLVYVSCSFSSCLGNAIATQHPESCDAFILTCYSASLADNPLTTEPASEVTARSSTLSLGYQVSYNAINRQGVLCGPVGTFDPIIFSIDVATQDTITLSQGATFGARFGAKDTYGLLQRWDCGCGAPHSWGATAKLFPAASIFHIMLFRIRAIGVLKARSRLW